MVTSQQALNKYGEPTPTFEGKWMTLWPVPADIEEKMPVLPPKIYGNKDIIKPLEAAFMALIASGAYKELKTWDGCFNVRKMRALASMSLHSWGIAIDVNQATNQLNMKPELSPLFVKAFKDNGFDWGGDWKRLDGMHFQLKTI